MLLAAAVVLALAPIPASLVERVYSNRAYPPLQEALTSVSNRTPFALLDGLIVVTLVLWLILLAADLTRKSDRRRAFGRALLRTAVLAAVLYLVFVVCWGLHYRRVPLQAKLRLESSRLTESAQTALLATTVAELNRLYDPQRAPVVGPSIDPSLARAFEGAQRQLGATMPAVPALPKRTLLLDWYFRRAGVDGMTDPFFLETLVQSDLLPIEQPMVVAHEWAHLAGYAHEGEANFVGWLTCLNGPRSAQYSGWLFLYAEAGRGLPVAIRDRTTKSLGSGPQADRAAIQARLARSVSPALSTAGWEVYDRYLKANRVESGTASYGEVVQLVLGTRLGAHIIERAIDGTSAGSASPRPKPRPL